MLAKYMTPLDLEKAKSCPPERGVLVEPTGNFDSVPIPVLPGKSPFCGGKGPPLTRASVTMMTGCNKLCTLLSIGQGEHLLILLDLGGATGDKPTCDPPVPELDVSAFLVDDGDYTVPEKDQAPFKLNNSSGWHDIGCFGTSARTAVFNGNVSYVDTGLNPGR